MTADSSAAEGGTKPRPESSRATFSRYSVGFSSLETFSAAMVTFGSPRRKAINERKNGGRTGKALLYTVRQYPGCKGDIARFLSCPITVRLVPDYFCLIPEQIVLKRNKLCIAFGGLIPD